MRMLHNMGPFKENDTGEGRKSHSARHLDTYTGDVSSIHRFEVFSSGGERRY